MALVVKDRVRETSTTSGTGTLTLAGTSSSFQTFSTAIGNGNTTYYAISDVLANTWEVGIGTVGAGTLSRDTVLASSNANALVTFSSNSKDVFCTYPAGKGLYLDASGNAIALGTPASATLTNATGLPLTTGVTGTLPIANGGTNLTTYTKGDIVYASATNTLGKLSDVATGNALISGGVGADPSWGKVGLTTHVSGTLPVANGGTGITSLGTGVATFLGTPSSSNLASAVTDETGSGSLVFATSPTLVTPVLGTPSSGTLTSCTGLPLTTGVTGTLPVTNGGTGTTTSFTTGSVVFAGSSGVYSQNNSQFFWDNTNNRLGVGTNTPSYKAEFKFTGQNPIKFESTTSTQYSAATLFLNTSASSSNTSTVLYHGIESASDSSNTTFQIQRRDNSYVYIDTSYLVDYKNQFQSWYTSATERMRIDSSGNVGIGTASPTTFSGYKTLELANSSGSAVSLVTGTSVIAQTISNNSGGTVLMGARSNHPLIFTTNDTERARIDTSGNVSINGTNISPFTFKNYIINGNFDIWQRGTTNTITTSGYTVADRWQYITDGTLNTGTVFSQQTFTTGQTDVPNNPTYFLQWQFTNVNTPGNYIRQRIENVRTLSGQTITISAWVRCTSGTISCVLAYQQEFGTGGSPSGGVYPSATSFTATTTWTKYTATFNVNSISGKTIGTNNDSAINIAIGGPSSGSGTLQIAQVQVERGSNATQFEYRPIQQELALCQRYYWRQTSVVSAGFPYPRFGQGIGTGGTSLDAFIIHLPVTMRTSPTLTLSNNLGVWDGSTANTITGAVNANDSQTNVLAANIVMNYSPTAGKVVQIYSTTSGQYMAADAEL